MEPFNNKIGAKYIPISPRNVHIKYGNYQRIAQNIELMRASGHQQTAVMTTKP